MKERLFSFITYKELSINQFETLLGVGNGSIRKILDNDSGISSKNIEKIYAAFPELNLDWLFTGRGEMLLTVASKPAINPIPLDSPTTQVVTVDTSDNIVVPLMDMQAAAGSPAILDEPDYYRDLPTLTFPGFFFRSGVHACFPVRGESMHPTIKQGDYVVGRVVEEIQTLRNGDVFVVIYQDAGRLRFFVKRCFFFIGDADLVLRSDNDDYADEYIPIDSIIRLYQVEAGLTTQFTRNETLRNRFDRIEKRLDRLTHQLQAHN